MASLASRSASSERQEWSVCRAALGLRREQEYPPIAIFVYDPCAAVQMSALHVMRVAGGMEGRMSPKSFLFAACALSGLLARVLDPALAAAPASSLIGQTETACSLGATFCRRVQVADLVCRDSRDCRIFNGPGKIYICRRDPQHPRNPTRYCFLKGSA
jgi:hypothetical protein